MSLQDGFNLWASKALFDLGMFVAVLALVLVIAAFVHGYQSIQKGNSND